MESIEEKISLESEEEIPFNSTQPTNKRQSFNFEANHVISPSPSKVSSLSGLRKMQISLLRSIYIVLIKAKINALLPFGPIAIMLHYLSKKYGFVFFFSLVGIIPLAERLGYVTEQLTFSTGPTGLRKSLYIHKGLKVVSDEEFTTGGRKLQGQQLPSTNQFWRWIQRGIEPVHLWFMDEGSDGDSSLLVYAVILSDPRLK